MSNVLSVASSLSVACTCCWCWQTRCCWS